MPKLLHPALAFPPNASRCLSLVVFGLLAVGMAAAQSLTGAGCPAASGNPEDPTYPIRKLAFDADAAGDHAQARHLMRCAIRSNPKDLVALRQEVYLDLNAKDPQGAAEDIDALRELGQATPQLEAQEGYIYAEQKKYLDARAAFGRAIATGDATVKAQSLAAIKVLDGEYPQHELSIGVDAEYLNRFSDGITDTFARYHQRLGARSPVELFANTRLLRDTASNGGTLPQIFSDNAWMTGAGLAFQPHDAPYFISAEANEAYLFYGSKSGAGAFHPDYRIVGGYFKTWRSSGDGRLGSRAFVEANGSFGYYTRYQHDAIAYLQPREAIDLGREGSIRLTPFLQQSVALDTNQQFYNNVLELIPGLEVGNANWHGFALRAEYVHGFYLPFANTSANTYGSSYNDLRFRLIFQRRMALGLGAR